MRTFKELLELYSDYSPLHRCYDEKDVIKELRNKHCDDYYVDENGIGTFDINEAKITKREGNQVWCDGYYNVEIGIRNIVLIKVLCDVWCELDEDGNVSQDSFSEIGWE